VVGRVASARVFIAVGLVAACTAASLLWAQPAAALAPCAGADIYIAAHEDDTLLFQSPNLLEDVRSNRCVRTVFTTAGDAGKAVKYWEGREAGAEAAYAQMAGVADVWQTSSVSLAGHPVRLRTLVGRPGISILYMRLPDGGVNGEGFAAYGSQSLKKLWKGGNAEAPAIAEIEADDKSSKYTYSGLIQALTAAIQSFGASQIHTQNYLAPQVGPDHSDHAVTGRFVKAAAEALPGSFGGNRLIAYEGYEVALEPKKPVNVVGAPLAGKEAAFAAYVPHDEACGIDEDCSAEPYPAWLARQYTSAIKTQGVVADAGLERSAGANSPVVLNGAASSAENGGPLGYSWSQVGGPPVAINGANSPTPSLTTPSHPTLLTFALTVNQGVLVSAPDYVRVRVPGASPNPTAVVGPSQSVAAGARVTLDGSASWDPESASLAYGWTQTGGPPVALSDPNSSTPSFTAPSGAASTLTFTLVVSNGVQASAPASVQVAVAAAPPSGGGGKGGGGQTGPGAAKLSRKRVKLTTGKRARLVVRATGAPARACRGRLPVGALCKVTAAGNVVVEARRSLHRPGRFHLTIRFGSGVQPPTRALIVVIKRAEK
jgi:hypothetical protein